MWLTIHPVLAIPWPATLPSHVQDISDTQDSQPRFIQVDIHICPSLSNLEWFIFKHAHGDLWNLLGSIIRPYGLTVDEVGLYLRIPEIEKLDRKKAKVLLTTDPCQVLSFLGLKSNGKEWEERFDSTDELFEYAATSRFFWVKPATSDEGVADADSDGDGEVSGDFRKKELKSNDRRRMGQRPLFRKWIEDFLPRCRAQGRFTNRTPTREETTEQAFQIFGVRGEYETRLLDFQRERQRQALWREVIKPAIPVDLEPQFRSVAASAMKKIIMQGDTSFGIGPDKQLRDGKGMYLEDEVRCWVEENWQEVGRIAWEKNHARFVESLAAKGVKRNAIGGRKEN